jgi:hypothetical protein
VSYPGKKCAVSWNDKGSLKFAAAAATLSCSVAMLQGRPLFLFLIMLN